jgi:2,4-dienoyl-CoA reductase-like NADH-dependent reductase (Old Yellow Enzyme family)
MRRDHYTLFSEGRIAGLTLPNRLVRSATWDASIQHDRRMNARVLRLYEQVAAGGVGLIITGDFSVVPPGLLECAAPTGDLSYDDLRIEGFAQLPEVTRRAAPRSRIIAQISGDAPGIGPSAVPSPFSAELDRPLTADEIAALVRCFVAAIEGLRAEGFDGVQLHAAHGGLLSRFLSPYTNRRRDAYGSSVRNRARIVSEIVSGARQRVSDFPILIKMNGTDFVAGGIDIGSFAALACEIAGCGVDAIEVSGGLWDSLVRSEAELGFRPVPSPEAHTRIQDPERQSYFLRYAEKLRLDIPVILVGGNRDAERLEAIVRSGSADFIGLCRPLISEPDLARRWQEGCGTSRTDCISCNACLYDMWTHVERGEPWWATCLVKDDPPSRLKAAEEWLSTWVEANTRPTRAD